MMVEMLAAEDPSVDGHVASTPRRRGMDGKVKPINCKKKLVQARLPFKRLNPEPKETGVSKRTRSLPCPKPGLSDGENESDCSLLPIRHGPALVNGRGPLDGFMSRSSQGSPAKCLVVDLTEDSNSTDALKQQPATPISALCPSTQKHLSKTLCAVSAPKTDHTAKMLTLDCKDEQKTMKEKDGEETASISQIDTTQGSDTEEDDEEQDQEQSLTADISSRDNGSMLSPSSTSSLSASEGSPEFVKPENSPAVTEPNTTPKIEQKTVKRRSIKSLQEQEERLRQREERERQREEAKAAKEKKKEEARKLKEEREKERKEKKEKEDREKREKKEKEEMEKAEKLRAKEEQRKSKQEAKLEEKRKKDEEKRLKDEKDRLKAEKAEITRFLQKPKTPQQATKTLASACEKFAPFEIKEHMCLAPLTRVHCEELALEELDRYLAKPDGTLDGLSDWTRNKPRRSGPTKPLSTDSVRECIVMECPKPDGVPDRRRYGRMKLLQFHENYRPAYWGTWSKKSSNISARCPLRQDKDLFDYDVDSDEEWEEEEPGESLSHSEGEDNEDGGDDDDDEDGFFVPHGYLSDGEGALEEEESGDLEKQKVRQTLKAREWDELMAKKKVKVLEAVVRGCVWEGEGPLLELFQPFAVCLVEPLSKPEPTTPDNSTQRQQADDQLLSQLLPLLHGNVNSSKVIITEFQEFCRRASTLPISSPQNSGENIPTRIRLKRLIKGNAVYEKRSAYRRCCWFVHAEVLARFSQEALPVPCQWNYLISGAHAPREEAAAAAATGSQGNSPTTPQSSTTPLSKTPSSNKRKSAGSMSITQFMKRAADPEQVEAMEMDGFQADTEEDEEEADCIIISTTKGSSIKAGSNTEGTEQMEVTPTEAVTLPMPRPTPTPATA